MQYFFDEEWEPQVAADLEPGTALRDVAVRHLANVLAVVQRVRRVERRPVSDA